MANRKLWVIAVGFFLILYGILAVTNIEFALSGVILGVLAVAGGILLLLDR